MMNTVYEFTKNGKTYTASGDNRFDAQRKIETQFKITLKGAIFTEIYKLKKVIRKGTV